MSLLEIRGLQKRFERGGEDGLPVLADINLAVGDGELLTIIGPSGSGKSTILNIVAQIDTPSAGEIWFRGRKVVDGAATALKPGMDRQIGYVTQDDTLMPWRTTFENVMFPLTLGQRVEAEQREKVEELMNAVGLGAYGNYYPHELSGGMRKRALLIRTLVYDPPVILMDEPFGALDAQTRLQLQMDLLRLWQLRRKTIIFVTHDIAEAIALGDRAVVLSRQPTRIAGERAIPFSRPRDLKTLLNWPGYADLYEDIRAMVT